MDLVFDFTIAHFYHSVTLRVAEDFPLFFVLLFCQFLAFGVYRKGRLGSIDVGKVVGNFVRFAAAIAVLILHLIRRLLAHGLESLVM